MPSIGFPALQISASFFAASASGAVVLYPLALFGFVRVPGLQELDPVLQSVFGEDEHDAVEFLFRDPLSLRLVPEMAF